MDKDLAGLEKDLIALEARFKEELSGIRSNRPSPKMIEDIQVEYFGAFMPIKQLGSIAVVPPRELIVNVWDKGAAPAVGKAIEDANLGVSVSNQGLAIRVSLPPLSTERRAELVKLVKGIMEERRIEVRSRRDEINKAFKAEMEEGILREDEKFRLQEGVQKLVDKANDTLENIISDKIKELEE